MVKMMMVKKFMMVSVLVVIMAGIVRVWLMERWL